MSASGCRSRAQGTRRPHSKAPAPIQKIFNFSFEPEYFSVSKDVTDKEVIPTEGVFVAIGQVPNETLTDLAEKDTKGYIIVNESKETSKKGIFACGDITTKKVRQIVTAMNDGAIAATSAIEYLNNLN